MGKRKKIELSDEKNEWLIRDKNLKKKSKASNTEELDPEEKQTNQDIDDEELKEILSLLNAANDQFGNEKTNELYQQEADSSLVKDKPEKKQPNQFSDSAKGLKEKQRRFNRAINGWIEDLQKAECYQGTKIDHLLFKFEEQELSENLYNRISCCKTLTNHGRDRIFKLSNHLLAIFIDDDSKQLPDQLKNFLKGLTPRNVSEIDDFIKHEMESSGEKKIEAMRRTKNKNPVRENYLQRLYWNYSSREPNSKDVCNLEIEVQPTPDRIGKFFKDRVGALASKPIPTPHSPTTNSAEEVIDSGIVFPLNL
jgi:hypothetical protein